MAVDGAEVRAGRCTVSCTKGFEPSNISAGHCRHCHRTDLEHDVLTEGCRQLALAIALEVGFVCAVYKSLPLIDEETGNKFDMANEKVREGYLKGHAMNYARLVKIPQFRLTSFLEFTLEMVGGFVKMQQDEEKKLMRKAVKSGGFN